MTTHTELLNFIAEKIDAKTYLEIGVFNPDHNFNLIKVSDKIGVDPDPKARATFIMESGKYFSFAKPGGGTGRTFDLIFIDGLHHADQVKKDIINAWDCLTPKGVIVIHDCNPHSEAITHVPRDSREWCGDVYKTICQLVNPKITLDFDYGCCFLPKTDTNITFNQKEITWEYFNKNRHELLFLVDVETGLKRIENYINQTAYANER